MSVKSVVDFLSRATGIGWEHPPLVTETPVYQTLEAQTACVIQETREIVQEARQQDNIERAWFRRQGLT